MPDYKNTPLIWFGNERIATGITTENVILRQLLDDGYTIAAIVINEQARSGKHKVRDLEIAQIAQERGIPLLMPSNLSDIANELFDYNARAGILVAYGKMVPQTIIDIFPLGIINVHPSLLPLHRGPTPLESAILAGDLQTGVSLMKLVKAMDAGPVYAQAPVGLAGGETKQALADQLSEIAAKMLSALLPGILREEVVAAPQDDADATYDDLIDKQAGIIDWTKPAARLEREVRAFALWPNSRTTLGDVDVIITAAHVQPGTKGTAGELAVDKETGVLLVSCGSDTLVIDRLKPVGKKEMAAAEFIRGYGSRIA